MLNLSLNLKPTIYTIGGRARELDRENSADGAF